MQKIVILGATGSLGDQVLEIIARYPDLFQITGLSAHHNDQKLLELVDRFQCPSFHLSTTNLDDERQVTSCDELIREDTDHLLVLDHGLNSFNAVLKAPIPRSSKATISCFVICFDNFAATPPKATI